MDLFGLFLAVFLVTGTAFLAVWSLIDWLELKDISLFDGKDDWD